MLQHPDEIQPGTPLGHYIIMDRIAQGGMGTVFKAVEPALERYVAIKVLRAEYALNEEYIQYFQDEARAIAALRHPNIVPIYFIGREGDLAYFSMPFIDGQTFDDWLESGRKFTMVEAKWFLRSAIAALDCAWRSGIIHLDIKPSNFLIDQSNTIMLTDFGLAKKVGIVVDAEREAFGTPAYVSPEQISRTDTDQRTDIYSLGATLYHLMVGKPVFNGTTVEEMVFGHLEKPFPAEEAEQSGLTPGFVSLIQKMMEREAKDRFQNYSELYEALQNVEEFRHTSVNLPEPRPRHNRVIPRTEAGPELLYGLLGDGKGSWVQATQGFNVKFTSEAVISSIKEPVRPLAVESLLPTAKELSAGHRGDADDLLEAFEKFPGFFDAMFQLAVYFHGSEEFETQLDVLETVGLNRARNLALTHYMLHHECPKVGEFNWTPFWQHSVTTGLIIELIYQVLDLKTTGSEFSTGLFHDVGKLMLADLHSFTYLGAMRQAIQSDVTLANVEHEIFGLDHAELGGWWLRERGLPRTMCEAIELHETTDHFKTSSLLPHALIAANQLSQSLGCGYSGNPILVEEPWSEILSVEILWTRRRNKNYSWDEFAGDFPDQIRQLPILTLSPYLAESSSEL